MSLLSRGADLVYTYRFLKILVTPFRETKAYELGLIDENGKRIKSQRRDTPERKSAFTLFHRLVFNIKRLLEKVPGGQTRIASYAAALFLLREKYDLSQASIEKILRECGLGVGDILEENTKWFILDDGTLAPGMYRIKTEKVLNDSGEQLVEAKDQVRVGYNAEPVGDIFGMSVFEATHIKTGKTIYVTAGELIR